LSSFAALRSPASRWASRCPAWRPSPACCDL
jgi:hypothetical protein